jgi:hypothetical protein
MSRRVVRVRTDVSEKLCASFIRVTRIGKLGTTLAVTSNRRENLKSYSNIKFTPLNREYHHYSLATCTA